MPIEITALPRTAVTRWLGLARLPLNAATRVARRTGDETWPPALAFDAFEAGVKGLAATVFHDDQLRQAADLGRERIARLRDAEALEASAERKRAEADRELAERRESAQERAATADERADAQQARLRAQEAAAEQRVEQETLAKQAALEEATETTQQRIDAQSLAAEQERIKAERDALAERRRAIKAKGRALDLDQATKATGQRRKARS